MRVIPTAIGGVVIVEPAVHADARGHFVETFHARVYSTAGLPTEFVQDNESLSRRHVLRGLHLQLRRPQGKLVRVVRGEVWDVAVDVRSGSPTFGRWVAVPLSADNFRQLFIPVGFAHGFLVVSASADIEYKCSDVYDPAAERGLMWNDPAIGIDWPIADPILSPRDRSHPHLGALRA